MKIVPISVKLVHATPFPMHVIESMGRICYQSEEKAEVCPRCVDWPKDLDPPCKSCGGFHTEETGAYRFVKMLIKRGHESVLEHVSAGFRIVTDRGVTHELVRHRLAAFSQESTRYCDYAGDRFGGELSFIEPPFFGDDADRHQRAWVWLMENSEAAYKNLRGASCPCPPELARSVLPNALKSEIGMTCNAREWRHVLRLRLSPKAHPQMRQVMALVAKELLAWCPALFEDVVNWPEDVYGR